MIPIWANNAQSPQFRYIAQVWKFLERYKNHLLEQEVILLGDFNSNTMWDIPRRLWNHSEVVRVLKEQGIESLYHFFNDVKHGSEPEKTFYLYRKQERGYHIDYMFASPRFRDQLHQVTVGGYDEWRRYSDHCPLICDFAGCLPNQSTMSEQLD